MQTVSETDSGSDESSDLSQEEYILDNVSESSSADESLFFTKIAQNDFASEFENEKHFIISID